MCCSRNSRAWYLFVVSFWFLLTVVRLIFDSIGKLWIPIVFNSFQVFSCICGLIAAVHWQKKLLIVFMVLSFISILYNIALILWYNEYFSISRDIPILSAGFPYSYSFFLRYTPSCKSYYNMTNFRWIQLSCIVPYYYIESAQALLHILLANLSIILSIILFPKRNCNKKIEKSINNMITGREFHINHFMSDEMNNNKVYNQGYSKKIFNLIGRGANEYARPENGYIRNSAEKPFKKCHKEVITAGRNPHNFQKPFVAKRSQSMIDLENECQKMGRILIQGSLTNMFPTSEGSQITTDRATNLGCVCRTESFKSFKMPTTEGVRQILSREEANLIDHLRTNNALKNSSNSNLKSLVSFDPKSNVLLRIHNHIDDDDDDDDNNGNDNDRNCHTDLIQRYLQQQQRISKQILSVGTAEQIQQQNLKCSSANNALANCQSNELTFDFTNMINNEYYGLTSFSKNCNHKSPNFLRQQPIYSKYGEDIMCDGTKQYIANKPSSIDHPKSQIISNIPIFNSSDFLV